MMSCIDMDVERGGFYFKDKEPRRYSGLRALLTAVLLTTGAEFAPLPSSSVFSPETAQASELDRPLEQAPVSDEKQDVINFLNAVYAKDLQAILKFLPNTKSRYFKAVWSDLKNPSAEIVDRAQVEAKIKDYFVSQNPTCLGVNWIGFAIKHPEVVFDANGHLVRLYIGPNMEENKADIAYFREVPEKDRSATTKDMQPCPVSPPKPPEQVQKPVEATQPKPEVAPAPVESKVEIPKEIAKGRIAFVSKNPGEKIENVFVTNADNFSPQKVSNPPDYATWPRWLNGTLTYEGNHEVYSVDLASGGNTMLVPKTFDMDKNPDGYLVECAGTREGDIYVSRIHGSADQHIFRKDVSGNWVQITTNTADSMVEVCSLPSLDGKYLAFQRFISGRHDPSVYGLVITTLDSIPKDVTQDKVIIPGNATPLEWSGDGNSLLVMTGDRLDRSRADHALLLLDRLTGATKKIAGEVRGATFSPDYKQVLYSVESTNGASVYLFELATGKSVRIGETSYSVRFLTWEKEIIVPKPPRKIVSFAPGITTEVVGAGVSLFTGSITDQLTNRLIQDRGFEGRGKDILPFSPSGWEMKDGILQAKYSPCTNSLIEVDTRARKLIDWWRFIQHNLGVNEIYHITHSEGGVTSDRAFEIILNENIDDVDLSNMAYISVDAPHIGINYGYLDFASLFWPFEMAPDCQTTWTTLPSMQFFNSPTGRYLIELWNHKEETRKRLEENNKKLIRKGLRIIALMNDEDCGIDATECLYPDLILRRRMIDNADNFVMSSQWLPGAVNIERFFGHEDGMGHLDPITREPGLSIITALVGDQYPRE